MTTRHLVCQLFTALQLVDILMNEVQKGIAKSEKYRIYIKNTVIRYNNISPKVQSLYSGIDSLIFIHFMTLSDETVVAKCEKDNVVGYHTNIPKAKQLNIK